MRIAIDIRPTLKKEKTGIGYYSLNLLDGLSKADKANRYILYSRIRLFSKSKKLPVFQADNFRYRIDRLGLGPPVVLRDVDAFYTSALDLKPPKGAKFILGVHDVIPKVFPQGHTEETRLKLEKELPHALSKADVIVVDAQCTLTDILRFYGSEYKEKIKVIYPGVSEEFRIMPKNTKNLYNYIFLKYNIHSNYIIYIGTLEPRKNVTGLIKAYTALKKQYAIKQQLVIAGMKGWLYEEIFKLAEESNLGKDIVFAGYVPREELKVFYNFADVCVYPSFYEGAGLPVLEAFKCGCPVVVSNVSSMPEFAGDAAILIDPKDTNSIADGIYRFLSSEELRKEYSRKGLKRASEFTWERTALQMLEVFVEN